MKDSTLILLSIIQYQMVFPCHWLFCLILTRGTMYNVFIWKPLSFLSEIPLSYQQELYLCDHGYSTSGHSMKQSTHVLNVPSSRLQTSSLHFLHQIKFVQLNKSGQRMYDGIEGEILDVHPRVCNME